MVERLQKPLRETVFVDLDGTLLKANSMKIFMRTLPRLLLKKFKLMAATVSLLWLTLRALRMISHKRMKWHLTAIALHNLSENDWKDIARGMLGELNVKVMKYIDSKRKDGNAVYIASAAPEDYTRELSLLLDFDGCLATPFTNGFSEYKELRGEEKLRAILMSEEKESLHLTTFLTDHIDDLPTACAYPDRTILVTGDEATPAMFAKAGVCVKSKIL